MDPFFPLTIMEAEVVSAELRKFKLQQRLIEENVRFGNFFSHEMK